VEVVSGIIVVEGSMMALHLGMVLLVASALLVAVPLVVVPLVGMEEVAGTVVTSNVKVQGVTTKETQSDLDTKYFSFSIFFTLQMVSLLPSFGPASKCSFSTLSRFQKMCKYTQGWALTCNKLVYFVLF